MHCLYMLVFVLIIFVVVVRKSIKQNIEHFLEFIHIPKNAGTTIENIADKSNIKWGRFKPEHSKYSSANSKLKNKCKYWHLPPKEFNENSIYKTNPTFCVLRNPYERVVSEYKYRNQNEKHTPAKMNAWIRKMLVPENYEDGGMNCHFIPQSDFIYDTNNNVTCDNILQFDNLTSEFNSLTDQYNIDLKLNENLKYNSTKESVTSADLDDGVKELLNHIYERDFKELEKFQERTKVDEVMFH